MPSGPTRAHRRPGHRAPSAGPCRRAPGSRPASCQPPLVVASASAGRRAALLRNCTTAPGPRPGLWSRLAPSYRQLHVLSTARLPPPVDSGDLPATLALLHPQVEFRSPAVHAPYVTDEHVGRLLGHVMEVFEDLHDVDELSDDGTHGLDPAAARRDTDPASPAHTRRLAPTLRPDGAMTRGGATRHEIPRDGARGCIVPTRARRQERSPLHHHALVDGKGRLLSPQPSTLDQAPTRQGKAARPAQTTFRPRARNWASTRATSSGVGGGTSASW